MTADEQAALWKQWGDVVEHVQKLAECCARDGMKLLSVSIDGMHTTMLVNTSNGTVQVRFPECERAIERQRQLAQTADFKRRHANCEPPCMLCNLRAPLDSIGD